MNTSAAVSARAAAAYTRRRARPPHSNFELWSWYFFRVSGVLLLLLAFGHLAIMHIVNNVDLIDYQFVADRWRSVGWRVYDWLLLVLALAHGQNGLRIIIDDYIHGHRRRLTAHVVNGVVLAFFLLVGTVAVAAFPLTPPSAP